MRKHLMLLAVAGILFLGPLLIKNSFSLHLMIMIFYHATLSCAWNIIGGYAGQTSLGHAAYFGLGAYTIALLEVKLGVSPWVGLVVACLLSPLVALAISYPCFRLRGPFFTLSSIAFAEVLRLIAISWRSLTNGAVGLLIPFSPGFVNLMFRGKVPYYYMSLILMFMVIAVSILIERTRLGYYLVAIKENEDAAQALGINTTKCKLIAMGTSALFTTLGGIFYAQYILFIEPDSVFAMTLSTQMALMAIIGGLGSVSGPVIGAFLLTPLNEFLRSWLGGHAAGLHAAIYGILLIVVVLLLPEGITPWLRRAKLLRPIFHQPVSKRG
ncbi:MAG: branched-chain amino acid ABC transporter permease [bacterium]|jgi:branched-chain amino acid transport system permease protein